MKRCRSLPYKNTSGYDVWLGLDLDYYCSTFYSPLLYARWSISFVARRQHLTIFHLVVMVFHNGRYPVHLVWLRYGSAQDSGAGRWGRKSQWCLAQNFLAKMHAAPIANTLPRHRPPDSTSLLPLRWPSCFLCKTLQSSIHIAEQIDKKSSGPSQLAAQGPSALQISYFRVPELQS